MRPYHVIMDALSCRDKWKDRLADQSTELLIKGCNEVLFPCMLICSSYIFNLRFSVVFENMDGRTYAQFLL